MNSRLLLLALLAAPLLLTGCVSSRYKVAPKSTPAPAPLNLAAGTATADVVLHSVIVYRGPGSWKRNAYWDEYVVSFSNRSDAALVLESADLTDFQGRLVNPGENPWLLEKESQSTEKRFTRGTGTVVKIGAGAVAATLPAYGVAAASVLGGGVSGATATLSAAVFPAYVAGTIYRNVASRRRIQDEFARRRLALPLVIPPGETRTGSLFFPIAPGPRQLAFDFESSPAVALALTPLSELHLAQGPARP